MVFTTLRMGTGRRHSTFLSLLQLKHLNKLVDQQRRTSSTAANRESSRSHAIFEFTIFQTEKCKGKTLLCRPS